MVIINCALILTKLKAMIIVQTLFNLVDPYLLVGVSIKIAYAIARLRLSLRLGKDAASTSSQAGDNRRRGRAQSRPLFLDGATEDLAASEDEDDEDIEDGNGEDVADESDRESGLAEDDVDGVGEWDNEDDETIGEGTRTTRRASECMPYPTNIKPYYIQAETGLKVPRRNPRYTTGKVNRGHYHTQFHGQFGKAWKFFGFKLLSQCLYPDPDMARRFAIESWCEAGKRCYPPTNYGYDDNILKNIEQRGSQLRGELKTAAKAQLGHYGIIKSRSKKIMRKNRALMKPLIELGQFTFEDHTDPDNAIMYANPALAAILRQAVFKKGRLGEYFQEEFELDVRFELNHIAKTPSNVLPMLWLRLSIPTMRLTQEYLKTESLVHVLIQLWKAGSLI
ncbi:hypothetical protein SISSUDRAFT_1036888 [Sistotremastrum suecicum HHB10207 ss-3]|uniref:DUF6532 domain-containing protein n=1 Tax=Sistotremastrum suecicum HHB10207 ss-3 TaxID=1314776 RepID=A0A165YVD9_9AGAM|nr:hypothetical protein SISSUDRAFT_1036888 [Sistotremastrum suecicum HHB10207 ss-3]